MPQYYLIVHETRTWLRLISRLEGNYNAPLHRVIQGLIDGQASVDSIACLSGLFYEGCTIWGFLRTGVVRIHRQDPLPRGIIPYICARGKNLPDGYENSFSRQSNPELVSWAVRLFGEDLHTWAYSSWTKPQVPCPSPITLWWDYSQKRCLSPDTLPPEIYPNYNKRLPPPDFTDDFYRSLPTGYPLTEIAPQVRDP